MVVSMVQNHERRSPHHALLHCYVNCFDAEHLTLFNAHTHTYVRPENLPSVVSLQRKGYRQHLVQALAEAASGPLPPSALLPILRAKETGPGATDLALQVLERITREEGGGAINDALKTAVIGKRRVFPKCRTGETVGVAECGDWVSFVFEL